jgi:spore photoproduct lyase
MPTEAYAEKFQRIQGQTLFARLPAGEQTFLRAKAQTHRFTLQELRQLCEIALDLSMWDEPVLSEGWPEEPKAEQGSRELKKLILQQLRERWQRLKREATRYPERAELPASRKPRLSLVEKERLGLGYCPVASARTRCCNLLTLDAIENCGFDCSYCSIQSFYHDDHIQFDQGFGDKLRALELDPGETYHIGTGQSSDSLLWGNKHGVLDALCDFARANPNVILELKTKSKNVAYLLEHEIPANILCTWSLNTPTLITHEEHRSASLEERLNAARQVADKGLLVGFHFHPMIHYNHWRDEYGEIFQRLTNGFSPREVALVSLGTLTYTKKVVKQIRERGHKSRVLQLPLVEADGKLSYPEETKLAMFQHAYQGLAPWHKEVFFYLCMENHRLWRPVFGYEYPTNEDFEAAMKAAYRSKINQAQGPG